VPLLAASTILFSFSNVEQMSLFGVKEGYFFGDGGGGGGGVCWVFSTKITI
jgi:hypothetical protein